MHYLNWLIRIRPDLYLSREKAYTIRGMTAKIHMNSYSLISTSRTLMMDKIAKRNGVKIFDIL